MIKIRDDKSYLSGLDVKAIENGIAELGVYSLRITNFFTEEQKQENSKIYETLTREQWFQKCEQTKQSAAEKVETIVDSIHNNFMIYQYKNKDVNYRNDNWDLFFWHNTGDMSYVTLNPNDKQSNEQQKQLINSVLNLVKEINIEGIEVTIQYKAIYNEEKVNNITLEYCEKVKNTFIAYGGYIGKIQEMGNRYVFRKKGAKKNCYEINNKTLLASILAE